MRNKFVLDKFVAKLVGYKSYNVEGKLDLNTIEKLKKPYFITIKSNTKKIFSKKINKFKIFLISKMVTYERSFSSKKNSYLDCREAKKSDIIQLKKICLEKSSQSRFFKDKMLPVKFRNSFRYKWLLNFFKKQRGDLLLVAYKNMKIFGFILILKKKFGLQIDLIVTSKKYQKRKVGTSLINYTIKNYLMKNQVIRAGTQVDNFQANSLYKKLGFKKINKVQYIYHVHST